MDISRRKLERHVDRALNRSVLDEIKRLRIDYIKRLLVETNRPMSDIASGCSFSSTSYFAKYFRSEEGVTPSEYRKKYQEKSAQ